MRCQIASATSIGPRLTVCSSFRSFGSPMSSKSGNWLDSLGSRTVSPQTLAMVSAQPIELFPVELICPAQIMYNFGNWFARVRMPLVVGKLIVFYFGAVFVLAFSFSEIHAYVFSVYLFKCQ